ncbi:hypothetical protein V8E55_011861 [Tylopilus felleus]
MRSLAALSSCLQASSSGSSTHRNSVSWPLQKNGNQSTTLIPGPSALKVDHPESTDTSLNIGSDMTLLKWRRTLNEVMEEREACRNAKIRKQSSSGGKLEVEVSVNVSQAALLLSAKMVSTLRYAQSSPPRPLFRSDWMAALLPPSTCQPSAVPGTAISNLPVTTPARTALSTSTSTTSPTKNPLKNFVVPGWARTSTAMLPQLSEEALARQRAEQEAKEAQMSLRRREAAKAKLSRKALLYHHPHHLLCPWSLWMQSNLYRRPRPSQIDNPGFPLFQAHRQEICPSRVSTVSHAQQVWLLLAIHAVGQRPRVIIHSQHTKRYSTSHPSDCHPRSPTVLHRSGVRKSPQKGAMQTPWTPMHSGANLQSPRSLCSLGNPLFGSPGLVHSAVPEYPPPTARVDSGTIKQESPSDRQDADQDKVSKEDVISLEPDDVDDILIAHGPSSSTRRNMGDSQGTSELGGIEPNDDTPQGGDGYASSPLPPSSPLPASPFSSPTKHHDSDIEVPTIDNLLVPNSDILLPSVSDSDGPKRQVDITWLSDDACATSWLTDLEASAWLTEMEVWLTDTEGGGPLLTDSDGAWLSDSEAVFGDMLSLPPSSASNWFSDDAAIDTDCEVGAMKS